VYGNNLKFSQDPGKKIQQVAVEKVSRSIQKVKNVVGSNYLLGVIKLITCIIPQHI
jgi:hypothetical protein